MSRRIAVVILNWNNAALTKRCVELARAASSRPLQLIVVDNGSREMPTDLPDDVELICNGENRGFTGGVNVGMRRAVDTGADFVWLLNNDAEPLPGALDALADAMAADPHVGLASPVILDPDMDDRVDFHGGQFDGLSYLRTNEPGTYREWEAGKPQTMLLVGTALLIRRALVERIGYFDETLFAYEEDIDYSRRSNDAGFRNIVVPHAQVRHHCDPPGQVINRKPYYFYFMVRNPFLVHRKFRDPLKASYWALRRAIRWHSDPRLDARARHAMRLGMLHGLLGHGGPAPAAVMRPAAQAARSGLFEQADVLSHR